jgi:hypothetical protein
MSRLRMERRRKIMTFAPVHNVRTNILLGYLEDLTLKGALMVSEESIEVGRTLTAAIEFREKPELPSFAHMIVSARVAWCRLEEHHTYFNVGMEFLEMPEKNKQAIEEVLEKYEISRKRSKPVEGGLNADTSKSN